MRPRHIRFRGGNTMFTISFLRKLIKDQKGATAVEYGLIIALIFLTMIGALQSVGNESTNVWSDVENASVDAMGG